MIDTCPAFHRSAVETRSHVCHSESNIRWEWISPNYHIVFSERIILKKGTNSYPQRVQILKTPFFWRSEKSFGNGPVVMIDRKDPLRTYNHRSSVCILRGFKSGNPHFLKIWEKFAQEVPYWLKVEKILREWIFLNSHIVFSERIIVKKDTNSYPQRVEIPKSPFFEDLRKVCARGSVLVEGRKDRLITWNHISILAIFIDEDTSAVPLLSYHRRSNPTVS